MRWNHNRHVGHSIHCREAEYSTIQPQLDAGAFDRGAKALHNAPPDVWEGLLVLSRSHSLGNNRITIAARRLSPSFSSSQVTFDEKSPVELLQLLNDVFAELDKSHKVRSPTTNPLPLHINSENRKGILDRITPSEALFTYAYPTVHIFSLFPPQVDVRDEPVEIAGPRMMGFLQLLKFPLPQER
jgi:hypothetical protein